VRKIPGFRLMKKPFKGQGLVEFALVLPVFLLLMIGIIEFGWFFFIYSTANSAAREAARYGAGAGEVSAGGPYYYQDCDGIREVATRIGRYAGIQDGDIQIWYDEGPDSDPADNKSCPDTIGLGERVLVQINVTYHPIIPLLNIPDIDIQAVSARTIVSHVQISSLLETFSNN